MKTRLKTIIKIMQYLMYKIKCKIRKQKEYILFATPLHGNLGDQAITLAENSFFKEQNIIIFEVATDEKKYCYSYLYKHVSEKAIILITGGGFIGSQWMKEEEFIRNVILDYKEHHIIILPQTIFYEDSKEGEQEKQKDIKVYEEVKNLTICTRERKSYELVKEIHKNANTFLMPDIVLSLDKRKKEIEKKNIVLCFRKDKEKNKNNQEKIDRLIENIAKNNCNIITTDTVLNDFNYREKYKKTEEKLNEFSAAKIVVTDRLHGMIFAAITGTNCIAFDNNNHKVKETYYAWLKEFNNITLIENQEESEILTIFNKYENEGKNISNNRVEKKQYSDLYAIIREDENDK